VSVTTARSFLLTDDNDLDISTGTLQFASGLQAMKQAVRSSVLLILGEWFLNTDEGTPWRQTIWVKNPNMPLVKSAMRDAITRVEGVSALNALSVDFNQQARTVSVSWSATCDFGVFDDDMTV
jgi:hypothetical protein